MDTEYFKGQLRHLKLKDPASNEFRFTRQTTRWIALKGPFEVYFTLDYGLYPKVKVMLTLEDGVAGRRAAVIKNCVPENGILVEGNPKRSKDIFSKEYDWTDKKTLETSINTEFMSLVKLIRNELGGSSKVA